MVFTAIKIDFKNGARQNFKSILLIDHYHNIIFDHNHEASVNINRQIIANSLKRKATDQVITRRLKLIRNEVQSSRALDLTLNDAKYKHHDFLNLKIVLLYVFMV